MAVKSWSGILCPKCKSRLNKIANIQLYPKGDTTAIEGYTYCKTCREIYKVPKKKPEVKKTENSSTKATQI